ncbi:MAG: nucleotide exchange factor GrpE [Firmicutes bacterium]|nr:nucleotide exchange factor GrpE [Bacillota bacterium]MBR6350728.1 nucleotide exchange factor GrpE [Bacillota bacterium]
MNDENMLAGLGERPAFSPEDGGEDAQTQYLRLAADFQNYKRRSEQEKSAVYAMANEKIATQLLDVLDNFERALDAESAPAEGDGFGDGMRLVFKQLVGILEKNNVTEIKTEGETFDPNFHNAVMTESVEGVESGKITKVFQKGYKLNEKVIRPAMVAVAQ